MYLPLVVWNWTTNLSREVELRWAFWRIILRLKRWPAHTTAFLQKFRWNLIDTWLFETRVAILTSKAWGSGNNGSAVRISVCTTSITPSIFTPIKNTAKYCGNLQEDHPLTSSLQAGNPSYIHLCLWQVIDIHRITTRFIPSNFISEILGVMKNMV